MVVVTGGAIKHCDSIGNKWSHKTVWSLSAGGDTRAVSDVAVRAAHPRVVPDGLGAGHVSP
jgi:hypothetical protein